MSEIDEKSEACGPEITPEMQNAAEVLDYFFPPDDFSSDQMSYCLRAVQKVKAVLSGHETFSVHEGVFSTSRRKSLR